MEFTLNAIIYLMNRRKFIHNSSLTCWLFPYQGYGAVIQLLMEKAQKR